MLYSLLFLVCTTTSCETFTPPQVFRSVEVCESAAAITIQANQLRVQRGELPPHEAAFQCVIWGQGT